MTPIKIIAGSVGPGRFNERQENAANELLNNLTFWSKKMKEARAERQKTLR